MDPDQLPILPPGGHGPTGAVITHLLTLLLGGGSVSAAWAYLTRRRETDAERLARFETRQDSRIAALEAKDDAKDSKILELTSALVQVRSDLHTTQHRLDLSDQGREALLLQVGALQEQNRILTERNKYLEEQNRILRSRLGLPEDSEGSAQDA